MLYCFIRLLSCSCPVLYWGFNFWQLGTTLFCKWKVLAQSPWLEFLIIQYNCIIVIIMQLYSLLSWAVTKCNKVVPFSQLKIITRREVLVHAWIQSLCCSHAFLCTVMNFSANYTVTEIIADIANCKWIMENVFRKYF